MATVEQIARACHEINRAYCQGIGDTSQKPWGDSPQWQKDSAIQGVKSAMVNPNLTPADIHNGWLREKLAAGWTYGEQKDPDARKHPCMMAYDKLPQAQRVKDYLFLATVRVFNS